MTIRDEARQEAERRYPGRYYQISRPAFEAGAVWASEQADRGCGHPNHGAEAHDCAPFLPDREEYQGPAAGCAHCVGAGGYEDYDGEWRECSCQRADREPSDLTNDEWATLEWSLWFLKRKHGYSALSSRDGSRVKFDDLTTKIRTAREVSRGD